MTRKRREKAVLLGWLNDERMKFAGLFGLAQKFGSLRDACDSISEDWRSPDPSQRRRGDETLGYFLEQEGLLAFGR